MYVYFSVATPASTDPCNLGAIVVPVRVIPRENSRRGDQGDMPVEIFVPWSMVMVAMGGLLKTAVRSVAKPLVNPTGKAQVKRCRDLKVDVANSRVEGPE